MPLRELHRPRHHHKSHPAQRETYTLAGEWVAGAEGMHGNITVGTHANRPTGMQASSTKKFCTGF